MAYRQTANRFDLSTWEKCPPCEEEERLRRMQCVYCRNPGPFVKKDRRHFGKHHVKYCYKAFLANQRKRNANQRKPAFKRGADRWHTKLSTKSKTRVTSGANAFLKISQDPFSVLGAMNEKEESERLKKEKKKKSLEDAELAKINAAAKAKKAPRPTNPSPALGGWLDVAKNKNKKKKKKKAPIKVEIPVVASPKRVLTLKKEAKVKVAPTLFKQNVLSFEEAKSKFSTTDCWGDSDDEW